MFNRYTYQVVGESKGPLPLQQSYRTLLALLPQPHQSVVGLSHSRWGSALEPPQPVKALGLWALVSSHQSLLALSPLLPPLYSRQSARLEQQASGTSAGSLAR